MKIKNAKNTEIGQIDLPIQFGEEVRYDLIKRAVLSLQSRNRQPYGSDPRAGLEHSANVSRRRRHYRGSYGQGISRVPRKVHSRSGTRFNWVGAIISGTRGGRRAHPPKSWKVWVQQLNIKERRKAIRSALSASLIKELVIARGHKVPNDYPFLINNDFEKFTKTSDINEALINIGIKDDLLRAKPTKIRAGIGKLRGRKTKRAKSILLVFSVNSPGLKAANNIPGVEAVIVDSLNVELLAPGTHPGRLTLYTDSAIKRIGEEKLFMNKRPKSEQEKEVLKKVVKKSVATEVKK